jgi:hypothetical protein
VSRLITPSLVGAVEWARKAPHTHIDKDPSKLTWHQQAQVDLQKMLVRDYSGPVGPALQRGIDFEDAVYREAQLRTGRGSEKFQWFVQECLNGKFQFKSKRYIEVDGFEYCLYGKLDVRFDDIIKDIKGTGKWKGDANYLDTFQHKQYCYTEHISKFRYLVAVFDDDNKTILETHSVDYVVDDWKALEQEVVTKVKEVVAYIESHKLLEAYTTEFSLY